ncbi:hypothetical protein K7X08_012128 [Anisodus acutangulus]|uniref:Uncharacterized protein n=1 Tax=Anisodus acutangulus TaxID=402998 RepID=A0A9Q1QXY3_9SOLA|nr:hypothetical protein K7X08_012128 [Anisodus acutangulus]
MAIMAVGQSSTGAGQQPTATQHEAESTQPAKPASMNYANMLNPANMNGVTKVQSIEPIPIKPISMLHGGTEAHTQSKQLNKSQQAANTNNKYAALSYLEKSTNEVQQDDEDEELVVEPIPEKEEISKEEQSSTNAISNGIPLTEGVVTSQGQDQRGDIAIDKAVSKFEEKEENKTGSQEGNNDQTASQIEGDINEKGGTRVEVVDEVQNEGSSSQSSLNWRDNTYESTKIHNCETSLESIQSNGAKQLEEVPKILIKVLLMATRRKMKWMSNKIHQMIIIK